MISKKTAVFSLCTIFLTLSLLGGCGASENTARTDFSNVEAGKLPVSTIQASFVYNPYNLNESVGIADYVFAGKVVSNDGTEYRYPVPLEDENGNVVETGTPYTHYTVQIIENIKGVLQTEKAIPLVKDGGIEQNRKSICLHEDDILPEVGENYIFRAYTQEDGSLLISGPNSNIPLSAKTSKGIVKSQEYQTYENAVKHQIVPKNTKRDSDELISIYDAKAKRME